MSNLLESEVLYAPPLVIDGRRFFNVIINPEEPSWVIVNQVGLELVKVINGQKRVSELIASFKRRLPEIAVRERAVISFYDELIAVGFIARSPFRYLPYTGRYRFIDSTKLKKLSLCWSRPGGGGKTAPDAAARLIDEAVELGCQELTFDGGEPLSATAFKPLVLRALRSGLSLRVVTAAEQPAEELLAAGRNRLEFYIKLRGRQCCITAATATGVGQMLRYGYNPTLLAELRYGNLSKVAGLPAAAAALGVKKIELSWRSEERPNNANQPQLILAALKRLKAEADYYGVSIVNNERIVNTLYHGGVKHDLCAAGLESLAVDVDGGVYPCHHLYERDEYLLGNLNKSSLAEVWSYSAEINKIRRNTSQRYHSCYCCYLKYYCGGLAKCYGACAHRAPELPDMEGVQDIACLVFKEIFEYNLLKMAAVSRDYDITTPKVLAASRPRPNNGARTVAPFAADYA